MTSPAERADGGVHGSTFHGFNAFLAGDHNTQNVQFIYQGKAPYRLEEFPVASRPVAARVLAKQPSRLLRAEHQVVPFTGRDQDLSKLERWRDDPEEKLAIRLVHGPGGQGKSRLAAHFAVLSRAAGWTVWQAALNEKGAEPLDTSKQPPDSTAGILLVVDYAERWPIADLRRLLHEPLLHRADTPVRVLLLARPAGIWWESLDTWIGNNLDAAAEPHPLLPLADAPSARAVLFQQARDRFADRLGLSSGQADRIGLPLSLETNEDYAQILTIHIAALAAVDAQIHQENAPTNPARASAYLLRRERAHWDELHQLPHPMLITTPEAMGRLVLTATLTRPLARSQGQSALARIGLAGSAEAANTLLDDHRKCYPPPPADPARAVTVLEPLYPDRLGEDFLGLTTPVDPDHPTPHPVPDAITDDWAHRAPERLLISTDTDTPVPWARDALIVLIEAARRWPHIATGQLYPLLKKHPELALIAGGTALAALVGLDSLDLAVLEAIEPLLPPGRHTDLDVGIAALTFRLASHRLATVPDPATRALIYDEVAVRHNYAGLRDAALTAGYHALDAWRDLSRNKPQHQPDLADSLTNLGAILSEMGRWEEALAATQEAVEVYRRLAAANPAAHEPDLARALTNLGADLSKLGRLEEALTAAQDGAEVYRRLAAANPAAHEPELARALTNFGTHLSKLGRLEEALTPTQDAVEVYRRLAAANPAAHEPELAGSLTNLGIRLSQVGWHVEALAAIQDAVEVHRRLAAANPAAHEPDLARALTNLGILLSEMGRREEALAAAQDAVEVYRRLAAANPAAHEPELASSLSNLGIRLSKLGRLEEALAAAQEAVEVYRRLAAANPAAHEPELARALTNLGNRLSQMGRREEALAATQEAVEVHRRLAAANPAAHEPDLGGSLTSLGTALWEMGRHAEALTAIEDAVDIRRPLAAGNPAAHEPDLAASLSNLGVVRSDVGLPTEALIAEREAVEIRRRLAAGNPAAHEPDLARSLSNLGTRLSDVGLHSEALIAEREAVEIRRRLAAGNPAAHEPDLASSLTSFGTRLSQVGLHEEALTAVQGAVEICRRLAAGNPAAYEPDLARSLWVWAWVRHETAEDLPVALRATGEAVEIYGRLQAAAPGLFVTPLGAVLGLQAKILLGLGRPQEASHIIDWIKANYPRQGGY
ncbi:tetratricopeptide repeat protein [Streptomyces phaeochromogenes]|uniref:tetratricopeptide repeat protein n=1 Tax=Streptomyces phaeochromogenes TaxID=1923 RepID=UPI003717CD23